MTLPLDGPLRTAGGPGIVGTTSLRRTDCRAQEATPEWYIPQPQVWSVTSVDAWNQVCELGERRDVSEDRQR
ncbi:predicted protein [Streptomyces viridosporus ATCC 14672]|uniref:Predicted protein n=1 Tax=Streptomyces viridosporus (strain ATCC 14672 / DSM 40746 / JCM 4963 / KCTC 9882 / NRRL B-12104 / FH 1290) TaxID=566461 RepID=D6A8G4_STRV1|nr:predicted protein [Streptomyces viridosporus ATCC 14672]